MRMKGGKSRAMARATVLAIAMTLAGAAAAETRTASFPAWAYPWAPDYPLPPVDDMPRQVPASDARFTTRQARDLFFVPDWHPGDHPPMPAIVAAGRRPEVRACGSCHRAEGTGGPENASLAGLPADYIVQQMAEFKSGARRSSSPERSPPMTMIAIAKAATAEEGEAAARYFAALTPKRTVKVIESATAPKAELARFFYMLAPEGGSEPLGQRILELPETVEQFELRDTRAQFLAYVPPGSVARGAALASAQRSDAALPCTACHGPELKGMGVVPGIAGRSPSYLMRQLYDFREGARAGEASALMRPVVEGLSSDDMLALAAYAASLPP